MLHMIVLSKDFWFGDNPSTDATFEDPCEHRDDIWSKGSPGQYKYII